MRFWIAAAFVTACHAAPPPAAPIAPVSRCAKVSDHLVSLMSAAKTVDDTQLDPIRKQIAGHCDRDQWSAAAQDCMLGIATLGEADRCNAQLTDAQNHAMEGEPAAQADEAPRVGGSPPATGAPPPPADASPPRSPAPKASRKPRPGGDPCEGGE